LLQIKNSFKKIKSAGLKIKIKICVVNFLLFIKKFKI
jgi:hypothetical protein